MKAHIVVVGLAFAVTGCAGSELAKSRGMDTKGSAFTAALYDGYLDLSQGEYNEADYKDSDVFALRARAAADGADLAPEEIAARKLPEEMAPVLTEARAQLVSALDGGGRESLPMEAAKAQVAFDCWMQEQEENFQPDDIAACRGGFETALTALKDGMGPMPAAAAAPAPAPAPEPRIFTVLFGFDDSGLSAGGERTLTEAIDYVKGLPDATVAVAGYTDRAGSADYNAKLSARRAEVVAAGLRNGGVGSDLIRIASFGEEDPAVSTDDGVREVRNRRVRIVVIP